MASKADLHVYQGDDYAANVTVTSGDTTIPPDHLLAGYTAQAQIRTGTADATPVVLEITAQVLSPLIILSIPHDQTETLSGNFKWDLQVVSPDGIITTLLAGNVKVQSEVTRENAQSQIRQQLPESECYPN
jgi:hypothetical protein